MTNGSQIHQEAEYLLIVNELNEVQVDMMVNNLILEENVG